MRYLIVLMLCACAMAQTAHEYVAAHAGFFEFMFTVVNQTSAANQDAYFHQLGLTDEQKQIVCAAAGQFRDRENALRDQITPDNVARIRKQRKDVLNAAALRLLHRLDSDGRTHLLEYIQRV